MAFPYYGGKQKQLKWLLPLLPKCDHYIEPFCGAASVLFNREISPAETINDTNGDIVNFFKVLRDDGDELIRRLELTPYARDEFVMALEPTVDAIEQARKFYIKVRQSFGGLINNLTEGRWGYDIKKSAFLPKRIVNAVDKLYAIANRLRLVQIENRPALDILKRYDHTNTLFYCDPPYTERGKGGNNVYACNEITNDDHRQLAEVLHNCKGKVAISGYSCALYNELYHDWHRHDRYGNYMSFNNKQKSPTNYRSESLWCNYAAN